MVDRVSDGAAQDVVTLLDGVPLTPDEAGYVEAARAANTLRGYRSDWREFAIWCTQHDVEPMPAAPATVTGYLSDLARHGAPPEQAAPLMPPELFDVLDACPRTKVWRTPGRPDEPDLADARDRALLL